jgi:hypothetical protein
MGSKHVEEVEESLSVDSEFTMVCETVTARGIELECLKL